MLTVKPAAVEAGVEKVGVRASAKVVIVSLVVTPLAYPCLDVVMVMVEGVAGLKPVTEVKPVPEIVTVPESELVPLQL